MVHRIERIDLFSLYEPCAFQDPLKELHIKKNIQKNIEEILGLWLEKSAAFPEKGF
jgi:hypothetical protein